MIGAQVEDLLSESSRRIAAAQPKSVADVAAAGVLIGFAPRMQEENRALKSFLRQHLYHHHQVLRNTAKARRVIRDLFEAFLSDPRLLPSQYQAMAGETGLERVTADYIAGMTDRYAVKEHRRIFAV